MKHTFKVNGKRFESDEPEITGQQILTIAQLEPVGEFELLYRINEGGFTPIQLDEEVNLKTAGIEGYRAQPYKKLTIKVNDKIFEVDECFMTPNEIMEVAGINSDQFFIKEIRSRGIEVTYKDDTEHRIAITKKSCFVSCAMADIECIIVNAREKQWTKSEIAFEEVVMQQYGSVSNAPTVIYTVNYKRGVPSKPEGSMVRGEVTSVKNKMIFNVTQTNKS